MKIDVALLLGIPSIVFVAFTIAFPLMLSVHDYWDGLQVSAPVGLAGWAVSVVLSLMWLATYRTT